MGPPTAATAGSPNPPRVLNSSTRFVHEDGHERNELRPLIIAPEDAANYVEYLLANGEWRPVKFKRLANDEISEIAEDYLATLERDGFKVSDRFRRTVRAQAAVPLQPPTDVP